MASFPVNHKTVFVLDHSAYFAQSCNQPIEYDLPRSKGSGLIPAAPICKSMWTCNVEGLQEYLRVVFDIYPKEKLTKIVVAGTVFNEWNCHDVINISMSKLAHLGPPKVKQEPQDYSLRHGLSTAVECLCQPTQEQAHGIEEGESVRNQGRIICVTAIKSESYARSLEEFVLGTLGELNRMASSNQTLPIDKCELVLVHSVPVGQDIRINERPLTESAPQLHTALFTSQSGRHIYNKLIWLCCQHFELTSTTVTGIPMKRQRNGKPLRQGRGRRRPLATINPRCQEWSIEDNPPGNGENSMSENGASPYPCVRDASFPGNGESPVEENGVSSYVGVRDASFPGNGESPVAENGASPYAGVREAHVAGNGVSPNSVKDTPFKINGDAPVVENGDAPVVENGDAPVVENGDAPVVENGDAPEAEGISWLDNIEPPARSRLPQVFFHSKLLEERWKELMKGMVRDGHSAILADARKVQTGITIPSNMNGRPQSLDTTRPFHPERNIFHNCQTSDNSRNGVEPTEENGDTVGLLRDSFHDYVIKYIGRLEACASENEQAPAQQEMMPPSSYYVEMAKLFEPSFAPSGRTSRTLNADTPAVPSAVDFNAFLSRCLGMPEEQSPPKYALSEGYKYENNALHFEVQKPPSEVKPQNRECKNGQSSRADHLRNLNENPSRAANQNEHLLMSPQTNSTPSKNEDPMEGTSRAVNVPSRKANSKKGKSRKALNSAQPNKTPSVKVKRRETASQNGQPCIQPNSPPNAAVNSKNGKQEKGQLLANENKTSTSIDSAETDSQNFRSAVENITQEEFQDFLVSCMDGAKSQNGESSGQQVKNNARNRKCQKGQLSVHAVKPQSRKCQSEQQPCPGTDQSRHMNGNPTETTQHNVLFVNANSPSSINDDLKERASVNEQTNTTPSIDVTTENGSQNGQLSVQSDRPQCSYVNSNERAYQIGQCFDLANIQPSVDTYILPFLSGQEEAESENGQMYIETARQQSVNHNSRECNTVREGPSSQNSQNYAQTLEITNADISCTPVVEIEHERPRAHFERPAPSSGPPSIVANHTPNMRIENAISAPLSQPIFRNLSPAYTNPTPVENEMRSPPFSQIGPRYDHDFDDAATASRHQSSARCSGRRHFETDCTSPCDAATVSARSLGPLHIDTNHTPLGNTASVPLDDSTTERGIGYVHNSHAQDRSTAASQGQLSAGNFGHLHTKVDTEDLTGHPPDMNNVSTDGGHKSATSHSDTEVMSISSRDSQPRVKNKTSATAIGRGSGPQHPSTSTSSSSENIFTSSSVRKKTRRANRVPAEPAQQTSRENLPGEEAAQDIPWILGHFSKDVRQACRSVVQMSREATKLLKIQQIYYQNKVKRQNERRNAK